MMRRVLTILLGVMLCIPLRAAWSSINIDAKTIAAMTAGYTMQVTQESAIDTIMGKILNHYKSAEVATAGIFLTKWYDRKALTNVGLFGSREENYYYSRIYTLVAYNILPKLKDVGTICIRYPERALYWGPYLLRVCEEIRQLCMQFEIVVTNCKVSLSELPFLVINERLRGIFDLAAFLGEVDWKSLFQKLGEFGSGLSKEDIMSDLQGLLEAGGALVGAGSAVLDTAWTNASKVGDLMKMKPYEMLELYDKFKDMYETFQDPVRIKNLIMEQIETTDSTGVANLFSIEGYNVTNYVSDYIQELQGNYYTQKWYIYSIDRGEETLCNYEPKIPSPRLWNGDWGEWVGFRGKDAYDHHILTANEDDMVRQLSGTFAGWDENACAFYRDQHPGHEVKIIYTPRHEEELERFTSSSGTAQSRVHCYYAYAISVVDSWDVRDTLYSEIFDSQHDDIAAINARFNAKLLELNDNEHGTVYYIGKDSKVYYSVADAAKVRDCASVSFTVTCNENSKLAEGTFAWKENGRQGKDLDERSQEYAMMSTLAESSDLTAFDDDINAKQSEADALRAEIDQLQKENDQISIAIGDMSIEDSEELMHQYEQNRQRINKLTSQLTIVQQTLDDLLARKQDLLDDYGDEQDAYHRIPSVMRDIESSFGMMWSDVGTWSGDKKKRTFVRHGNVNGIEGVVTFTADLVKTRDESRFFGIRYHRAILSVEWKLVADFTTTVIADVMDLTGLDDEAKVTIVNDRLKELIEENPGCSVEPTYAYKNPEETDEDPDSFHLLWVSDRLALARHIESRLSYIYADLVLLDKFLRAHETLQDYLRRALHATMFTGYRHGTFGGRSYRRWMRAFQAATAGKTYEDIRQESDD